MMSSRPLISTKGVEHVDHAEDRLRHPCSAAARAVGDDRPRKIHEIAAATSTPVSVLEQLMPQLRGAGIVRSERGPSGGYRLNHVPADITLGRVVRTVQGPLAPISCATRHEPEPCPMEVGCAAPRDVGGSP